MTTENMSDEQFLSLRSRIYYAAKEGFAKQLLASLKEIKDDIQRNILVNQVSAEMDNLLTQKISFLINLCPKISENVYFLL